jgi:hypothetical protein
MSVTEIVKNLIQDIQYRLEQDEFVKSKDEDGNDIETKNVSYLELSDINDYMQQLELYSNFVKSITTELYTSLYILSTSVYTSNLFPKKGVKNTKYQVFQVNNLFL